MEKSDSIVMVNSLMLEQLTDVYMYKLNFRNPSLQELMVHLQLVSEGWIFT